MQHSPGFGAACGGADAPGSGGGLHQQRPGAGAGLAQRRPEGPDRAGVAGHLAAQEGVGELPIVRRRGLELHAVEVEVHLLGQDGGDGCVDPLPHLDLGHDQGRGPRAVEADEGVGLEDARLAVRRTEDEPWRHEAHEQAAARRRAGLQ